MAKVFYVRDGDGDDRASHGKLISAAKVASGLANRRVSYRSDPPVINAGKGANPYSAYEHVVVEIEQGDEFVAPFSKTGYYLVHDLSAGECEKLLFE
jgi:hypothetical protein